MRDRALKACATQLIEAYRRGEENDGSIEWSDVDDAHASALYWLRSVRCEADLGARRLPCSNVAETTLDGVPVCAECLGELTNLE